MIHSRLRIFSFTLIIRIAETIEALEPTASALIPGETSLQDIEVRNEDPRSGVSDPP